MLGIYFRFRRHSGHGRTFCWLAPVANDPLQTFASHLLHRNADIQAISRSDPLLCFAGIERFRMDAP